MNLITSPTKRMKTILLFLSLLFCTHSSCQQQQPFQSVTAEEFATAIAQPEVQRLDVRTPAEYSEGHIAGSLNINVESEAFAAMADSLLDKSHLVALYCRSGRRSKKAAALLAQKGYKVVELGSGIKGWQAAGMPVEE